MSTQTKEQILQGVLPIQTEIGVVKAKNLNQSLEEIKKAMTKHNLRFATKVEAQKYAREGIANSLYTIVETEAFNKREIDETKPIVIGKQVDLLALGNLDEMKNHEILTEGFEGIVVAIEQEPPVSL